MNHRTPLSGAAMTLAAIAIASGAGAEELEPVVITAIRTTPLEATVSVDKTGTPIQDVPRSIQVVPRDLIDAQGATRLRDTLSNVSGLSQGGQFAFGFYDRFVIRGLNASFLNDGLPDGTSDLGGYVHSLTGVERVEILKGPGSALYGSAQPGGTINLVHFRPSHTPSLSLSEQYGSHATTTTDASLSGPTPIAHLDARLDGEYQRSDGFRDQRSETAEVYGTLGFHPTSHDVLLRFEYHHLENRPDAIGLPFSPPSGTGLPLNVPATNRYYTPFAFADQDIKRTFLSDAWRLNDQLVVHLRTAYSERDVDLARNAGGRLTAAGATFSLTGRQLRAQTDHIHDFVAQAEPTWTFSTGTIAHTLVTGAEVRQIGSRTVRSTADLPNIADIYNPVIPETSLAALTFRCDATHSCNSAELIARFHGLYAIDQIDLSDRLKLRLSARENWFRTSAEGLAVIPSNPGSQHPCVPAQVNPCPFVPGQPVEWSDQSFSWDAGAVYFLTDGVSVFGGYANTVYPIFNTEEPQSVGQLPETGTQPEVGLRVRHGSWLSLSSTLYQTTRKNVFTLLLVPNPSGPGNIDVAQVFSYRIKGWETDLNLRPTSHWNVIANLAFQDSSITDYPQTPAFVGNRVPSVPSMLANLWTSYDIAVPHPIDQLQFALGGRYRNLEYPDAGQTRQLPGATLYDLTVAVPNKRWTLRAGVQNLFDRAHYTHSAGTGTGAVPGDGRTYFLGLAVKPF